MLLINWVVSYDFPIHYSSTTVHDILIEKVGARLAIKTANVLWDRLSLVYCFKLISRFYNGIP